MKYEDIDKQATIVESDYHLINDKSVYNCVIYLYASWKRSMSWMRRARLLQESYKSQKCLNSSTSLFFIIVTEDI